MRMVAEMTAVKIATEYVMIVLYIGFVGWMMKCVTRSVCLYLYTILRESTRYCTLPGEYRLLYVGVLISLPFFPKLISLGRFIYIDTTVYLLLRLWLLLIN